jgi:serine/threonine protein kinase/tetratricopeptide (TPR) repeat protein
MLGRTLSHYKVLDELSRGGMGVVYRAVDTKLNREVAIKVLPPELVADRGRRERFVQEAQASAALEHPHIAVVYEIDEVEGVTFIVMELIRGEKLRDRIDREPLSAGRALELATEIAEGLACAHDHGIVHRDLKSANVMLTEEGHVKIIDFGLAKLLAPLGRGDGETATAQRGGTDPGVVLGTVSYMSPEQARGTKVDHRSDVFSFGILLYEMLARKLPFQGPSSVETLNAILRDAPPRLDTRESGAGPEANAELQRILDKCLAKDPSDRYQTMKDVVVDLRSVRRRADSGSVAAAATGRAGSRAIPVAAAAAVVLAGAIAYYSMSRDEPAPEDVPPPSRPSIAVLYFENVTGDPSLDWLRTGLTDMLVTDLSQSPQLQVLSTDRLYQILKEMNRLDERVTSLEVVDEVAERAGAGTILLGSFMKAGDSIRINLRIQEAGSGRILTSERVEGVGESSLFPMVDDLTRRVKEKLDVAPTATSEIDRGLQEVTTSSVEAYRFYNEGLILHFQLKERESIPLFEKAVEVDPSFAMALARLSVIHRNLGLDREANDYSARALAHSDRLPLRERYYIEGAHYSSHQETWRQAIEAYEKAVELFPELEAARNNAALRHSWLEEWKPCIEHGEKLRAQQTNFPSSYGILSQCYDHQGRLDEGGEVFADFLRRQPDSSAGHRQFGFHQIRAGRLDEALQSFAREASLDPSSAWPALGRWNIALLREDWDSADAAASEIVSFNEPFWKYVGHVSQASNDLFRGRSRDALVQIESAARAYSTPGAATGEARILAADLLLQKGELSEALEQAKQARQDARGDRGEFNGLFVTAVAQARLGDHDAAAKTAAELGRRTEGIPGPTAARRNHHLSGVLALLRGDSALALVELRQAEAMLPPRSFPGPILTSHVPIWFSLATAHSEAGHDAEAARWFQRIADSADEHVEWPIPYVRSFYFLGKHYEALGDMTRARENYRRFVEFWKDGDLDRDRVEEAKNKL